MDVHMIKSRTFRKTLLSYTLILIIPISIFSYISIQKVVDDNYAKLMDMHYSDTQRVAGAIDAKLMELMHIGDRLYQSKWVNKLMMETNIFDDEFDVIKRQEINQELNNYVAFTGLLSNMAVVFPYKDLIVSQNGWYRIDDYFLNVIGIEQMDLNTLKLSIKDYAYFKVIEDARICTKTKSNSYITIFQSLELNSKPRAVLLFFINEQYLESYIRKIAFSNLYNLTILDDGAGIFTEYLREEPNEEQDKLLVFTTPSEVTSWEYTCMYDNADMSVNKEQLVPFYMGVALSLCTGIVMALVLAIISYKPLYGVLNSIFKYDAELKEASDRNVHEYNIIEDSFGKLVDKNEEMARRVKNYESAAKNNLLVRLLKGYFDDADKLCEKLEEVGLTYSNNHYFCVILINIWYISDDTKDIGTRRQEIINSLMIAEHIIDKYNVNHEMVDVFDDTFALILRFDKLKGDTEFLNSIVDEMELCIKESCNTDLIMVRGNLEKGIIGISKSYQMARESLEHVMFGKANLINTTGVLSSELYYYPTDWEIQLINNLKIGDLDTVTRIIDEMRLENERRNLPKKSIIRLTSVIMETQLRVLDELNVDTEFYQNEFERIVISGDIKGLWNYIYEVSDRICYRSQYANKVSDFELGHNIVEYINENYNNPNLSLKELAGIFDMPVSSLSKLFKEITGINYYDYLCRIRMEKAKTLLKDNEIEIKKIANEVGYQNEYSFRRAFKRYEGVAPTDYVKCNSN